MIIKTKFCKKCGIERDIDLFSKKESSRSPGCRKSICRICKSKNGILYSFYIYPTEEMNKISITRNKIINRKLLRDLRLIKIKEKEPKLCKKCKSNHTLASYKHTCEKCKKELIIEKRRRQENIKIKTLKNSYIKHLLRREIKEFDIRYSDIPENLIKLKRKQLILTRTIRNNGN